MSGAAVIIASLAMLARYKASVESEPENSSSTDSPKSKKGLSPWGGIAIMAGIILLALAVGTVSFTEYSALVVLGSIAFISLMVGLVALIIDFFEEDIPKESEEM